MTIGLILNFGAIRRFRAIGFRYSKVAFPNRLLITKKWSWLGNGALIFLLLITKD